MMITFLKNKPRVPRIIFQTIETASQEIRTPLQESHPGRRESRQGEPARREIYLSERDLQLDRLLIKQTENQKGRTTPWPGLPRLTYLQPQNLAATDGPGSL